MIKPNPDDPLKIRRILALFIVLYAFLILPLFLILCQVLWQADTDLLKSILLYMGTLACGPIGAYLYAAHKN